MCGGGSDVCVCCYCVWGGVTVWGVCVGGCYYVGCVWGGC